MTSELADLEHHLDLANKANFHGLPGKTKAENLRAMSRIRNKLDALDCAVITAFEATKEHAVPTVTPPASAGSSTTAGTTATPPPCAAAWPDGSGTCPWPMRRCWPERSPPATSTSWTGPGPWSATTPSPSANPPS